MDFSSLNYLAIVVAAVAAFAVGFLWHGPLFGNAWITLSKMTPAEVEKGKKEMSSKMPLYMVIALVQQFMTALVIALLSAALGVHDTLSAIVLAFLLWLGLIVTTLLNGVLWEKRTVNLYLFNITYHLVSLVVIALIVGLWK